MSPLWWCAVGLWAGALLAGPWPLILVGLAGLAAAGRAAGSTRVVLVVLSVALAGSGLAGGRQALRDGAVIAGAIPGPVELTATVVTEPRRSHHGWWFVARAQTVDGREVRERTAVRTTGTAPALGERITARGQLAALEATGFHAYLARLHAVALLEADDLDVVAAPGRLLAWTNTVRERTRQAAAARLDDQRAMLLAGLVVGDNRDRTPADAARFAASGLSHLVVVSGRHVAIMLAALWATSGALGVGARGRRRLALGALVVYVLLTRWQPSVLRASVMAGLVVGAGLMGRPTRGLHSLAGAVVLLLLADPMLAGQTGFVLSVLATAGVLVLAPRLAHRLRGPRSLRLLAAAAIGAQAGAAPVLLALFDGVPVASVPANLLAVPAAGLAQVVGLVAALCAQVSIPLGGHVAALAGPPLAVILWTAETFSTGPTLRAEHLLSPVAVMLVGAVITRRRRPRLAAVMVLTVVAVSAWPMVRPQPGVDRLGVVMLDVGQGDAVLVEVPPHDGAPGARMLVDAGPEPGVVLGALRARGLRRLDAVALSHPHDDHSGGLPAILRRLRVGALLVADVDPPDEAPRSVGDTTEAARRRGVPVVALAAGDRFRLGAAWVQVLGPPAGGVVGGTVNDQSLVLLVDAPGGRILLTGDVEEAGQLGLLARPQLLRADLLKVPHHGGATNATGFLRAVGASVALIGVGEGNDYGHPHPRVLDELRGVAVYRTDVDGTVTVCLPVHLHCRDAPSDVSAGRSGGAAAAPGRRPAPRRAAGRRRARGRRATRLRAGRAGPARSAHRLAVRHTARGGDHRRPGTAGRGVLGAGRRAGARAS